MFCKTKHKLLLALLLIFLLKNASANNLVHINISDTLTADAAFYLGDTDKPVVLILHGFMLTHNFPVVKRLAESLYDSGYTVLSPTLSLGISHRKKTLPCEAIHTHSLEQDIKELSLWIKWLKKKTKQKIVLIGHSAGSPFLAYYLMHHAEKIIQQVIFITMPDIGSTHKNSLVNIKKAQQLLQEKPNSIDEFEISYCKKYPSLPQNYLSYSQLTKKNISSYLQNITIKQSLILGTEDKIIDHEWNQKLTQYNIDITTINGADHFFDGEYEFDLMDSIEAILSHPNSNKKPAQHTEKKANPTSSSINTSIKHIPTKSPEKQNEL